MSELIQVHAPVNAAGKPRLVFIHGLDGDVRKTWMAKPKDSATLWPKWIGEETGCPVWLLGYGAAMSGWKADAMSLPRQATAVIERLSNEQDLMAGPLILAGHSLGGLVIKAALKQATSRKVVRHEAVAKNVKGIAFVGTPHFGSWLATLAAWSHLMRANPQVSDLRLDDANLEELNRDFLALREELEFKTRIFREMHPVRLPWWAGGRFLPGVTIVSPGSSEAHIPGEVGIPIEANHITIAKPKDRNADIYTSFRAFVREVEGGEAAGSKAAQDRGTPMSSDRFEANALGQRVSVPMHLAMSVAGINVDGGAELPVCASALVTSDAPERLRQQLLRLRSTVCKDPLIAPRARDFAHDASLLQLAEHPGTRAVMLRELAAISFSAYLYYADHHAFNELSEEVKTRKLFVEPLVHRLSKRGEHFEHIHTRLAAIATYSSAAGDYVLSSYHRNVKLPKAGTSRYAILEELSSLVATISARYLSSSSDDSAAAAFESIRTRVRFAQNVVTQVKHKRDENPLP